MNTEEQLEQCDRALRYLSVRLYGSESSKQDQQLYDLIDKWLDKRNEASGEHE